MPRRWTEEQKQAKREEQQRYWQEHAHPMKGTQHHTATIEKMKKPKKRRAIGGHCSLCGHPLYDPVSIKRGMGPECAGLR